jgi:GNAT superfamily N-acetyltransferase
MAAAGAEAAAAGAGAASEISPPGWLAAGAGAGAASAAEISPPTTAVAVLERAVLKQDKLGKFLFPGGVAETGRRVKLNPSHMFFGVTKLNGEDTFPYYDKNNFSKPEHEGEFEFEKMFMKHIKNNCLSLINTGFMFDTGQLTLESLKNINTGIYSTNDKSDRIYKSTYLCYLLVTGSDSIPILVSTGILVITKDNIGHLWSFVTNPAYSGKGYGSKFLEHIKNLLLTRDIKILRLIVSNSNYPFMSFEQRLLFYSKNDFRIFSQNGKDNIKFITPDRKEHTLKLIAPLSSMSRGSSKSGCTLTYSTKIGGRVVQHTNSVSYDYLKKNTIISVINPKNEIIGQCDIESEVLGVLPKPIDQKTLYSSPPGRLYSCLFHGEILSKSFNQGTIKTFKVPSNVELIVVNQIGSALYAYQWFYFLHIYNYYGFSEIPIEILKFIFPNIRTEDIRYAKRNPDGSVGETTEKEIIIPSLIKDYSHLINATKKRSGSIVFQGTGDKVRDDSFTVSAYGPGDVCPNLALSMTIHTNAGRNWKIYDMALREGGLRVSKDGKNLYVPSHGYSTDKMLSSDRVWPEPKNIENYTDMTEHPEKIDPGRFIKPTETLETMVKRAIKHTILNTTREDVDEDVKNIRIVVGCCAGLYRNYSPSLLKHLQQAMFVPGYDTLKRVQYTSHKHLITLLNSFGEKINSFTRSISSGSLLNMDVRSSKYSDVRDIMLKRLHHYLAGTHHHSSIIPIGRAPMSRKTRRNKKRNKNKTKRKHLNKHTS